MKFNEFFISSKEGKSNCVIRTFCKMFNEEYDSIYNDLCSIAKQLECSSFNDIQVFERYMKEHDTFPIKYDKDTKIKDLDLNDGNYAVFCWDKKDFYHMVSIIDNNLYDKDDRSLELYAIKIYKQN